MQYNDPILNAVETPLKSIAAGNNDRAGKPGTVCLDNATPSLLYSAGAYEVDE